MRKRRYVAFIDGVIIDVKYRNQDLEIPVQYKKYALRLPVTQAIRHSGITKAAVDEFEQKNNTK